MPDKSRSIDTLGAVSSLATAPEGAASGPVRATARSRSGRPRPSVDAALGLSLAAGLVVLAFVTTGGLTPAPGSLDLGPNTWAEIALTVLGAGLCIAALLLTAPGRMWGGATFCLFCALALLTAASIVWSVQPDYSWLSANQTLAYLAAFAGAIALARVMPERWPALVGAIAVLATVLSGYALLVKIFPGTLDAGQTLGRLQAPFGYWNAIGLIAAFGLPPCLWAGAQRDRGPARRALTVPAIAVLIAVIVLSYSRSAVLVAVLGVGCWLAIVPLRLRAVIVLALGAVGAAALAGWALATPAFTSDNVALPARTTAGHTFGLVLVLTLVLLTLVGLAAAFAMDRIEVSAPIRRRVGTALIVLAALVPLAGVAAVAASSRGLTGELSHVWSSLTSTSTVVSDNPGRLLQLGSSRPRYWHDGLLVGQHNLLKGAGALGYSTARTRYTTDAFSVKHAHSYVIQTFADFGLIGVAISLALLIAWWIAARRTLGSRLGWANLTPQQSAERSGLMTLLVVAIMFGIQSATDWTWFIPGVTIPALICAGWLAGRGPLTTTIGRPRERRPLTQRPAAGALATFLAAFALLAAWVIWQPLRSADADAAAASAAVHGDATAAFSGARSAAASDPLAVQPLFELSALYTSIDPAAARAELMRAVRLQPANIDTWLQLGYYELQAHQLGQALAALSKALALNPTSVAAQSLISQARSELQAAGR